MINFFQLKKQLKEKKVMVFYSDEQAVVL